MSTPARQHFQRTSGAQSKGAEGVQTRSDATQYELMLAKLAEDRRRLHEIQSLERKAEVKREILPDYGPWIDGVLAGDQGVQDDVLMTVMVWRVDSGDLAGALQIARYALRHQLAMPDQYKRTTACLIAEEFSDSAIKTLTAQKPVDIDALIDVVGITQNQDMPDEVRAKLHKALGYAYIGHDPIKALGNLKRALELHEKVGVKKDIEKLERELKNAGN
jgi:hypothetical protein